MRYTFALGAMLILAACSPRQPVSVEDIQAETAETTSLLSNEPEPAAENSADGPSQTLPTKFRRLVVATPGGRFDLGRFDDMLHSHPNVKAVLWYSDSGRGEIALLIEMLSSSYNELASFDIAIRPGGKAEFIGMQIADAPQRPEMLQETLKAWARQIEAFSIAPN